MSHLKRIIFKTDQVRNFGPALPHYVFPRYLHQKKLSGLRQKSLSPFVRDSKEEDRIISRPNVTESKNQFGRREQFYPKMGPNFLKGVKSVAGISVTTYNVGWSRIDLREKNLTDFGSVFLSLQKNKYPEQPSTMFKVAKATRMILPQADLYILENPRALSNKMKDITAAEIQLLSMLTVLLNIPINGDANEEKVFFQNRSVIDYLYELSIKSERISAGQKLQRVLNEIVSLKDNKLADNFVADFGHVTLNMKSEFVLSIFSSQPLQRDSTAIAFFLALSFIEMNRENIDF